MNEFRESLEEYKKSRLVAFEDKGVKLFNSREEAVLYTIQVGGLWTLPVRLANNFWSIRLL